MKKTFTFIPNTDAGKDLWLKNFASKLPQYAAKYNISAAEQTDITQASAFFAYWLNYKNQVDEFNKKLTTYKNEVRDGILPGAMASVLPAFPNLGAVPAVSLPGVFDRAASIGNRIKKHISYTSADGRDMGLEKPASIPVDLQTVKPVLGVRLVQDGDPEIMWVKKSMDRIEIHVDRGEGYGFLTFDTYPNHIDVNMLETGTAAVWKYKAIYIKNDVRVGSWSDEVRITVTGKEAAA